MNLRMLVERLFTRGQPEVDELEVVRALEANASEEARTFESYYARTVRIREAILRDEDILASMKNAFESRYLGKKLSDTVVLLGQGDTHTVLHVGTVTDSQNGRSVHVALRLKDDKFGPYDGSLRAKMLFAQLKEYQHAFLEGRNPPYFVGIVSWTGPESHFDHRLLGFVLEDVSHKKRYPLTPDGHEYFFRAEGDGKRTRFFLDPPFFDLSETSSRYMRDEARIDL